MNDEPFSLKRESTCKRKAPRIVESDKTKQGVLFAGADCIAGQTELFNPNGKEQPMFFNVFEDNGRDAAETWLGWIEADSQEHATRLVEEKQASDRKQFDFILDPIAPDELVHNPLKPDDEYA